MPLATETADATVDVATLPLHLSFQRVVDIFRVSDGDNIARLLAGFQDRVVWSGSRGKEEQRILDAFELSLSDLREADEQRSKLSKTGTIRRHGESLLGFGATSPAGSSWSGG